jgi:hypothetical protein
MGKKNNSYTASYKLKVISFAELLEYQDKTQIKTSTQKKSAYFSHPDFSAAKIEKKVRKLREQIQYIAQSSQDSQIVYFQPSQIGKLSLNGKVTLK